MARGNRAREYRRGKQPQPGRGGAPGTERLRPEPGRAPHVARARPEQRAQLGEVVVDRLRRDLSALAIIA